MDAIAVIALSVLVSCFSYYFVLIFSSYMHAIHAIGTITRKTTLDCSQAELPVYNILSRLECEPFICTALLASIVFLGCITLGRKGAPVWSLIVGAAIVGAVCALVYTLAWKKDLNGAGWLYNLGRELDKIEAARHENREYVPISEAVYSDTCKEIIPMYGYIVMVRTALITIFLILMFVCFMG